MLNSRLTYLFEKYLAKTYTEAEKQELSVMLLSSRNDADVKEFLQNTWDNTEAIVDMPHDKATKIIESILTSPPNPLLKERGARVHKLWRRVAAAAAIIMAIAGGSYLLLTRNNIQELAKTEPQEKNFTNDIAAPVKAKATITLTDGSIVALDSVTSGTLATQSNVSVTKTADGRIVYAGSTKEVVYNTLTNPRGSLVVDMTLADGSRVWLNAGSSVTFPVAFSGTERKVTITGEAYFEVTHNASMPFVVQKNDMSVQVLGTHFNVNAYDDETEVKITLLEGSVKVAKGNLTGMLKPGQQAQVGNNPSANSGQVVKVINNVDLDEVMAWKNGRFYFNAADIQTIMRQVARWYDVEVVYEDGIPAGHFNGKPSRDLTVSEMLKVVEYSGVKVRIEGKKIIVLK